jgi:hypothetical protein
MFAGAGQLCSETAVFASCNLFGLFVKSRPMTD